MCTKEHLILDRFSTLKDASGVEPGCVEIMPLNRGTRHVLT